MLYLDNPSYKVLDEVEFHHLWNSYFIAITEAVNLAKIWQKVMIPSSNLKYTLWFSNCWLQGTCLSIYSQVFNKRVSPYQTSMKENFLNLVKLTWLFARLLLNLLLLLSLNAILGQIFAIFGTFNPVNEQK